MSIFVRASAASILAMAAIGCAAQASVQPPPVPTATVQVGVTAPPPPVVGVAVVGAPPPPVAVVAAPPPPVAVVAVAPGAHPAYLHALTDLRNARANLAKRGGDAVMKWDEHFAIEAIDKAMAEIKRAAIDDGKNLEDHPPLDVQAPRGGRLHRAIEALAAARNDVNQEEDNAYAQGLKARAIHHIDEAIRLAQEGLLAAERAQ
jgi:hypothetical protein